MNTQKSSLTMQVLDLSPMKESLKTWVNFEALKGKWPPFRPRALIHSFNASSDLLISAPSIPKNGKKNIVKLHMSTAIQQQW